MLGMAGAFSYLEGLATEDLDTVVAAQGSTNDAKDLPEGQFRLLEDDERWAYFKALLRDGGREDRQQEASEAVCRTMSSTECSLRRVDSCSFSRRTHGDAHRPSLRDKIFEVVLQRSSAGPLAPKGRQSNIGQYYRGSQSYWGIACEALGSA